MYAICDKNGLKQKHLNFNTDVFKYVKYVEYVKM